MELSDKELIGRYRKGDVEALEALVEKYRRPLFGFILNMTEGRRDADEVFQEVWFKAIRKFAGYRHKNLFGWLVRIAHNVIIDQVRREKPIVSLDSAEDDSPSMGETIPESGPGPFEQLEASDIGKRIAAAVKQLPDEQREVFVLRVQSEMPFKEIARIQKVSINTALARMQYALTKLRPLLREEYEALGS